MSPVGKMRLIITLLLVIRVSSTDMPTITFLQKSRSSPVTCHATGFSPEGARLYWTKDGQELETGVEVGETVSNYDGTFQKSSDLDLSSVPGEDWGKYNCVFQFTESKEVVITKLDKKQIEANITHPATRFSIGPVIGAIIGFLIIAVVFAGVCKYKKSQRTTRSAHLCPCGPGSTL